MMALDPSVVFRSIRDLSEDVRDGRISPISLVEQILERIEVFNPQLNAFITVTRDRALADARQAAHEIAAGRWRGALHGIPVAVKDFYDTAGVRTTAAFAHFQNRVPSTDADLVSALRVAGAVLVGKTNMHTLGKGTTSLDSHFGPVVNPWSAAHVAGGSSGGSAVAVASGLCYATVDTDAIGSGRLPAAICGVSCLKPTFGLLSPVGILAGEPVDPAIQTLGHPCVTARSADDVATVLWAILKAAGSQGRETPSGNPRLQQHLGVAANYAGDHVTRAAMRSVVDVLAADGMVVRDVNVPFASASFDLTRVERDRTTINASLFGDVSAVVVPTLTAPAPTVEEARVRGDLAVAPQNTFFCNYYGLPAITVPMAGHGQLPLGVQFVGPSGGDAAVLGIAARYQDAAGWQYLPPPAVQPEPVQRR